MVFKSLNIRGPELYIDFCYANPNFYIEHSCLLILKIVQGYACVTPLYLSTVFTSYPIYKVRGRNLISGGGSWMFMKICFLTGDKK